MGTKNGGRLDHDQIHNLRAAVISAHLTESRAALLAHIPVGFVATLPAASVPGQQVLLDIDAFNAAGELADGSVPLEVWLINAVALAGGRRECKIFQEALDRCRSARSSMRTPSAGVPGARVPGDGLEIIHEMGEQIAVRLYNVMACAEWSVVATPEMTLLQVIGRFKDLLSATPWPRVESDVPHPGAGYLFRCYPNETASRPLSLHDTVGKLLSHPDACMLSLNVEWYRAYRGHPRTSFR